MLRATDEHPEPDEIVAYGRQVVASLQAHLGDELVGACYVGSIALGGYVHGESDVDIVAVSERAIPGQLKPRLADAVLDATRSCPARGLEFTLYRREVAASAPLEADFELNVNGGPRMAREVHLDARLEPPFWYVIDRAIAHAYGVSIGGPSPAELFADVPRPALLEAMIESMRWHREHEQTALHSVLNATRAWRFAVDDALGSKPDGAAWARERWPKPWVIDAALELRQGRPATLDPPEVEALLAQVEGVLLGRKNRRRRGSGGQPM